MGGFYRHIRHPQYLALMIASVGMLLIWPRFLVLFSTCFVFLAYILLAKAEEGICLRKYDGYADHMATTGRFLPKGLMPFKLPELASRLGKLAFGALLFIGLVGGATIAAFGIRSLAISSFYTVETNRGVYLSITEISDSELQAVAQIATSDPQVAKMLESLSTEQRILAYVLPTQMYVSEIPMYLPAGERFGHSVPQDRDPNRYKVIFTKAEFAGDDVPDGKDIISKAVNKYPLLEVQINLANGSVETTFQPPEKSYYPDVQVPLF